MACFDLSVFQVLSIQTRIDKTMWSQAGPRGGPGVRLIGTRVLFCFLHIQVPSDCSEVS